MSEAAAQRNIDTALARMREVARNGVEPSTGRDSWLARQNRRVTGSRRRAKGVQLTRRVSMAEARAIYHAQQETCCATGQPIILGNGGSKSPFSAAMVLVGASETVQLMGSWTARGQGVCPLAAYKDFFEYWGVEGHEYMRFLKMGPDGEPVDELERQVKAILRVDGVGPGGDGGTGDDEGETEGVSNASRPEPKCETRPPPLPFADIDYTWAAMRVPLSEVTVNPRDEKHRRDGLSLLRPSPCLAEFDDAELQKSAAYKGPVLVEKDNLALRWAGRSLTLSEFLYLRTRRLRDRTTTTFDLFCASRSSQAVSLLVRRVRLPLLHFPTAALSLLVLRCRIFDFQSSSSFYLVTDLQGRLLCRCRS